MAFEVSVVIPMWNAERYIAATLASLDAQTLRPHEVIVVDDGSTDGSVRVAERFRFSDGTAPRLLYNAAQGAARARNRGVFHASGDWVSLCDSDDLWHPRRLETLAALAERHPEADAVATAAIGFALQDDRPALEGHPRTSMVSLWAPDDRLETLMQMLGEQGAAPERRLSYTDFQHGTTIITTLLCIRRETYALAGGCAPWCYRADDHILHACVAQTGAIVQDTAPLVFYRVRPASESHTGAESALPLLSALLALRFGARTPSTGPVGVDYEHFLELVATSGAPFLRTLGFALLGEVGWRFIARCLGFHLLQNAGTRSICRRLPRRLARRPRFDAGPNILSDGS